MQKAVGQRGGIKKIRCLAARQDPDVEIEISLSEYGKDEILWRYALGIKQEPRGFRLPYLTFEKVWKRDELILKKKPVYYLRKFYNTIRVNKKMK